MELTHSTDLLGNRSGFLLIRFLVHVLAMSNIFTAQLALWRKLDPVLAQCAVSAHSVHWHPVCSLSTPVAKPHNFTRSVCCLRPPCTLTPCV